MEVFSLTISFQPPSVNFGFISLQRFRSLENVDLPQLLWFGWKCSPLRTLQLVSREETKFKGRYSMCHFSWNYTHVPLSIHHSSQRSPHYVLRTSHSHSLIASADFKIGGQSSLRAVPPLLLTAEKEEARAILTLFLKKQGLSNAVAVRTINNSDIFIDHLVCKLHSIHKSRYIVGRELTTLEIRESLIPYLEALLVEHGADLTSIVESFQNPPAMVESTSSPNPNPNLNLNAKQKSVIAPSSEVKHRPESVLYLTEIGLELKQINDMTRRFRCFPHYSLEGKIKPLVKFLLGLGVPKPEIPTILFKRPQLCGVSLSENLVPTMELMEGLGVERNLWAKVICRFPGVLTYSRAKVMATVEFLREMGVPAERVGKVFMRCPTIVSYSIEGNLRPTSEYFWSLGIDVTSLLYNCPQVFGLSVDANLRPATEFFMGKGYSAEELGTMMSRFGVIYTFSLRENITPKWEFFLTMGYPGSELVKFPQYFGYSLEKRIKPRYALVKEKGVKLVLNQVLSCSEREFHKILERKMKKMLSIGNGKTRR